MKCGSLKRRDEREQTLDTKIYPVVWIATKTPLHPRCWSTHEEHRFPAIKSLPWTQSRSPWSRFPLKELAHEGGVSVLHTMLSTPLHTKPEGSWRAGEPPMLQGAGAPRYKWLVHSITAAQGSQPCLLTHSRANLALTLTKLVLNLRIWSISSWMAWRCFSGVYGVPLDSSNHKWLGARHIYSPTIK